jgi:hypothetical protein
VKRQKEDDRDLEEFIAKIANSFVKIELIKFFYNNPHFLGTAQDLAIAIGRDVAKVSKGTGELVATGMIDRRGMNGGALWSYGADVVMHKKVTLFIRAYEERDRRQWIVGEVIRRGG